MKSRTLVNGQKVKEARESTRMTIDSKCPRKWLFVDMETGDVWMHKSRLRRPSLAQYNFYRADEKAIQSLVAVAVNSVADKIKKLK